MSPPAPCTVTLPAHQRHAGTPPPAPIIMSASRQSLSRIPARSMRPRPCLRASCPERFGAMRSGLEPRSSFACPRLASSPIQPCPSPLAYVAPRHRGVAALRALRFAQARASATASPCWPCASRHRCERSSHGARSAGLPFGPARVNVRRPPHAFCERCGFALTPFAKVALRALSPRPTSLRSHHAASGSG